MEKRHDAENVLCRIALYYFISRWHTNLAWRAGALTTHIKIDAFLIKISIVCTVCVRACKWNCHRSCLLLLSSLLLVLFYQKCEIFFAYTIWISLLYNIFLYLSHPLVLLFCCCWWWWWWWRWTRVCVSLSFSAVSFSAFVWWGNLSCSFLQFLRKSGVFKVASRAKTNKQTNKQISI